MKLAIVIPACDKYEDLWNFTLPNRTQYCERHGYDLLRSKRKFRDESVPFGKLEFVRDNLEQYDWIWMLGADTLHMNMATPADEFIDEKFDMIIGRDANGLNCDSVLFKNTQWIKDYINFILGKYDYYKDDEWQEQRCIIDTHEYYKENIKVIPQKSFNSYVYAWYWAGYGKQPGEFSDGDAILHFVGMQNDERISKMKDYIPQIKQ